jgi:Flp pilus assembly protein TadD
MDSSYKHALYNRGDILIKKKDFAGALSDLNSKFNMKVKDYDFYMSRSYCYLSLGDTLSAYDDYFHGSQMDNSLPLTLTYDEYKALMDE